jgi:hypothetical protein
MTSVPPESQSWSDTPDPEAVANELREQLAQAKARMQEHREQMHAAGLTKTHEPDGTNP